MASWGTGIKSIQRGVITLAHGDLSETATITAVVTAKTMLNYLGNSIETDSSTHETRIVLTDTTTITANRAGYAGAVTISYEVIEYY